MLEYQKDKPEFYPSAKIIADSFNTATGDRLTTMVIKFHRDILAQFNKHRVFSSNTASSRAIPVEKMIQSVIDDNVYPLHFGKAKRGMQATEEIAEIETAKRQWTWYREDCIHRARQFLELGLHKQVINTVLESVSTTTVIVTSTEWQNFFNQRCTPAAQPEMQAIANEMKKVYELSEPKQFKAGEWHLPFITEDEVIENSFEKCLAVSVGRCARVSYLNHEGVRNVQDDINLHDKLISSNPPHLSPLEHSAVANSHPGNFANFTGWQSYRNILEKSFKILVD
jgi:thymidylate synthase ThyX